MALAIQPAARQPGGPVSALRAEVEALRAEIEDLRSEVAAGAKPGLVVDSEGRTLGTFLGPDRFLVRLGGRAAVLTFGSDGIGGYTEPGFTEADCQGTPHFTGGYNPSPPRFLDDTSWGAFDPATGRVFVVVVAALENAQVCSLSTASGCVNHSCTTYNNVPKLEEIGILEYTLPLHLE